MLPTVQHAPDSTPLQYFQQPAVDDVDINEDRSMQQDVPDTTAQSREAESSAEDGLNTNNVSTGAAGRNAATVAAAGAAGASTSHEAAAAGLEPSAGPAAEGSAAAAGPAAEASAASTGPAAEGSAPSADPAAVGSAASAGPAAEGSAASAGLAAEGFTAAAGPAAEGATASAGPAAEGSAASAGPAAEGSAASVLTVAGRDTGPLVGSEGSTRQRTTRVGSRTSSAAVSREASLQTVNQQQQQQPQQQHVASLQPAAAAASEASEPASLADWKAASVASSRSSTPAVIAVTTAQHQPGSQQQHTQQQCDVAAAEQQPGVAAPAAAQAATAATTVAGSSPSVLGSDSGLRNALAKLRPVRTTAENAAGVAGGQPPRVFKAATVAAASSEAPMADTTATALTASPTASASVAVAADDAVMTPMYYKSVSNNLLGLTIQRSTPLKPDMLVTNPVVRLHVVCAATGEYVRMVHRTAQLQEQPQQQYISQAAGANNSNSDQSGAASRNVVERPLQDKMLESLGRPALTTVDNNTACPRPALFDYVSPIQTHPYDILEAADHNSINRKLEGATTGLIAEWNEELCVDLSIEQLKQADALLLLEVLQLPSGFARFQHHVQQFDLAGRSHPIAWAFLRLQGLQAPQQQLAQGKPLQLQLYHYKVSALKEVHALSKGFSGQHLMNAAKAAYLSWKMSGFAGAAGSSTPNSPRSPLKAVLGGFWPSRDGSASLSTASATGGQQQPLGPPAAHGRQVPEAEKYPGILQVVVTAKPRPAPEQMIVITDPVAGVRPDVPAGYGSGFEHGRIPFGLLHKPRALGAAGGRSFRGSNTGAADAGGVLLDQQLLFLESRLHRPHTQPCQVPNAVLVDIKGTAGGCSCIATSRDGRWLVAALADAAGRFKINLYQALTGRLLWTLGTHEGMVYSINWSKDDSAVITTSADYTAKVWHLPVLPNPGSNHQGFASQDPNSVLGSLGFTPGLSNTGSAVLTATAAAAEAAAEAGVVCTVLQHRCFVYAGELHPVRQPWLLAVTGAYDGILRVWSAEEGTVVYSLQVSTVPINCLCFNQLGSRLFAGDAAGSIHELSVDITPLSSMAATAFGALVGSTTGSPASPLRSSASSPANADSGTYSRRISGSSTSNGQNEALTLSGSQDSPRTPRNRHQQLIAAEAVSPVAAVLRHGSPAARMVAGQEVLKVLRTSIDLSGSPIVSVACHPGGHQLIALTKACSTGGKSKGMSDLVVIDMKLLLVARRLGGVKCCSAPLKFGVSPDGEHVMCGSEEGLTSIWHFETATETPLPHMALGGAPVYCMAWSSCFHAVAVCSFSPYAPIRILCYSPDELMVQLNPHKAVSAAAKKHNPQKARDPTADAGDLRRYVLPGHLTPHHVHAVLADLRESAAQRGLYKQPDDPHGEHLVIKAANTRHGNAASRHQNRHISPHSEQQPGSSSSQQQSEQHRQARPAGRLDPPEDSNAAYGDSNGLVKVPEQGSLGEGASRRVGGRNRANRRSKDTIPGTDPATAAIGNASGAGGLPITPKVVLNRRGAAAGGTAAPWLQTQTAE